MAPVSESPALQAQAPPLAVGSSFCCKCPKLERPGAAAAVSGSEGSAPRNTTAEGDAWTAARLVEQSDVGVLDRVHLHCGVITRRENNMARSGGRAWRYPSAGHSSGSTPAPKQGRSPCPPPNAPPSFLLSLYPLPTPRVPLMLWGAKLGFFGSQT